MDFSRDSNRPPSRRPTSELFVADDFEQPIGQLLAMFMVVTFVAVGFFVFRDYIVEFFQQSEFSRYILGLIIAVFAWGIYTCFSQMLQINKSVRWIRQYVTSGDSSNLPSAPSLLTPLANLLGTTAKRASITTTSAQSILDTVLSRIDEHRESTRYITNLLIFLGLLGTFIGLAIAVPQISQFIKSLSGADPGNANLFEVIVTGLDQPLSGMGVAFSSSLVGLTGSLIIGLLDLFVGISQNRFYRTLEEWITRNTRLTTSPFEREMDNLKEQSDSTEVGQLITDMRSLFVASEENKFEVLSAVRDVNAVFTRIMDISEARAREVETNEEIQRAMMNRLNDIVERQNEIVELLNRVALGMADSETRLLLRSIEIQLLRILEENANSRVEFIRELRTLLGEWQS